MIDEFAKNYLHIVLAALAWIALATWLYLAACRGRFWRMDLRLPQLEGDAPAAGWPSVVVVIPARDEAAILPSTLPTLLAQDYPGALDIIVVDDASSDGTGQLAAQLAERGATSRTVQVVRTDGPPPGWAGKVAAMDRGLRAAAASRYVLFTDSDIAHPADSVRRLVQYAEAENLDQTSLMVLLNTGSAAERALVPAFVFSFFQLYPPSWVSRSGARTAVAAGGCMLVLRETLERAGGLARIADARIDDVALGTLLKRSGGRIWLGTTESVRSLRPYPRLADLWNMIARSAYTQLRYSPWLLIGAVLGLVVTYAVPPGLGLAALLVAVLGNHSGLGWAVAAPCLAAWALMSWCYLPVLRLYRLRIWRAPLLPAVMAIYAAMTVDSARRHRQGRGGSWKGRLINQGEGSP